MRAVERAIDILACFTAGPPALEIGDLQRRTRLSRPTLYRLLQTLQAGNGQDAEAMARACGVSRRTVFRDLETLRSAGVPLQSMVTPLP